MSKYLYKIKGLMQDDGPASRSVTTPGVLYFPKENDKSETFTILDYAAGTGIIDGVVDLSYRQVSGQMSNYRNTANCYIVTYRGDFLFPLVYGNAIKDGVANSAAYRNNGATYSTNFVNHLGNQITDPWIEKNSGCAVNGCEIVWQDDANFISNISLQTYNGNKYIRFTVNRIPNVNANAILACNDSSGNIMWSWHIWGVANEEEVKKTTISNRRGVTYDIMNVNLGWKWDSDAKVKGKNVFYQWGRKDPMPCPAAYNSGSNISLYGSKSYTAAAASTIADAIKNPHKFFTQDGTTYYNWFTGGSKYNLWNASVTGATIGDNLATAVKTVYDPCPFGWCVPAGREFDGFTTEDWPEENAFEKFNTVGSFNNGWKFKRNSSDIEGLFFPASGYRNRESGSFYYPGSGGCCWSSASSSTASACHLGFDGTIVFPVNNSSRAYGFSVRPVREFI